MANLKYSELLDDVLPSLSADPSDPVTEHAIKRAVIEFCAGSWIWKHFPDAIDVLAGEAVYDLEPPSGSEVAALIDVELDGAPLSPRAVDTLNRDFLRWKSETGTPRYFTQVDTEQLVLAPTPDVSIPHGLMLTLALQPAQSATSFPGWIGRQYLYVLVDGALARLMEMPQKPWSDPQGGLDRRARFEAGIAKARYDAISALGRATLRTRTRH